MVWVDARGLPARRVARGALRAARQAGIDEARVGVARVALVAEIAARYGVHEAASRSSAGGSPAGGAPRAIVRVAPGNERAFLAAHPMSVLLETERWPAHLRATDVRRTVMALADAGIETCGALAALAADAIEVRFGAVGVALWRLAGAHDERAVFPRAARSLPAASLEWSEYTIDDSARLVFIANRLVERVCAELRTRGEVTRSLTVELWLDGGGAVARQVRGARASADRATWLRLVRDAIERTPLPDRVRGLALRVDVTTSPDTPQGDLFDTGFQTAAAAEAAVSRLIDDGSGMPVRLVMSGHALPERRVCQDATEFHEVVGALRRSGRAGRAAVRPSHDTVTLALRLLTTPRRVAVVARARRDHLVPIRYREQRDGWKRAGHGAPLIDVVIAAGPDRIVTGHEIGAPVAREYWQCLTDDGRLVLLFRDASATTDAASPPSADETETWYLQGWWD